MNKINLTYLYDLDKHNNMVASDYVPTSIIKHNIQLSKACIFDDLYEYGVFNECDYCHTQHSCKFKKER